MLGRLGGGKAFGELAILYNCKRTASIKVYIKEGKSKRTVSIKAYLTVPHVNVLHSLKSMILYNCKRTASNKVLNITNVIARHQFRSIKLYKCKLTASI